jgi:hypothetical protein
MKRFKDIPTGQKGQTWNSPQSEHMKFPKEQGLYPLYHDPSSSQLHFPKPAYPHLCFLHWCPRKGQIAEQMFRVLLKAWKSFKDAKETFRENNMYICMYVYAKFWVDLFWLLAKKTSINNYSLAWWHITIISVLGGLGQENLKFEASLGNIVSSRLSWTT